MAAALMAGHVDDRLKMSGIVSSGSSISTPSTVHCRDEAGSVLTAGCPPGMPSVAKLMRKIVPTKTRMVSMPSGMPNMCAMNSSMNGWVIAMLC